MLVELTSRAGMLYGEQVKLSTPKLRQNKEKNKNSDFWNHNNEDPLHLEGKPSSIYCFPIDWCDVMHDGRNVCWNQHHFIGMTSFLVPMVGLVPKRMSFQWFCWWICISFKRLRLFSMWSSCVQGNSNSPLVPMVWLVPTGKHLIKWIFLIL